jgi:Flp pilus assembly protein TadD
MQGLLRPALSLSLSIVLLALMSLSALAADTTPMSPAAVDTEMQTAKAQIAKKDWAGAIATLEPYTKAQPNNADGFNLLGYSYRNLKRNDESLVAYKRALTLDPKHKGAHEYIGMAYLQMRQPEKAKEHLATLSQLCRISCEEYRDLKKAVAAYK